MMVSFTRLALSSKIIDPHDQIYDVDALEEIKKAQKKVFVY